MVLLSFYISARPGILDFFQFKHLEWSPTNDNARYENHIRISLKFLISFPDGKLFAINIPGQNLEIGWPNKKGRP